jgi:phosphoribosylformylglycinamidine synthase subunit PurQ / glutaminase
MARCTVSVSSIDRTARPSTTAHHARPPLFVLRAPGINCDRETMDACRLAGAEPELVHVDELLHGRRRLDEAGMLVIPGGFSYGDHLGAGSLLATILRHRLMSQLDAFVADHRPVLGICNGFQVLARLGFLGPIALAPNQSGLFDCRWLRCTVSRPTSCIFLRDVDSIELPIAHGQGRVMVADADLPAVLLNAPLRYVDNPNGSTEGIAGVCNHAGTVFGLMPHPERAVYDWQHPGGTAAGPSGLRIFQNAVAHVRSL